jgi:hypothetical protein
MVEGIPHAVYYEVESLEVGERSLRNAVERYDVFRYNRS